jgi:anaerobic selenocysteine-containing dehydrogenase
MGRREISINGKPVMCTPVFELVREEVMKDDYVPENAAKITDIPAETIRQVAREYATVRPSSIIIGMGINHRLHGDLTIRSILLLSALTGGHGKPGETVSIYSGQHHFRIDVSGFWFPEGKRPKPLPMHYFVLGKPTETINPKIQFPEHGVKALFVSHANPLVTEFSSLMRAAIDRCELFVVFDYNMSPTCEYADVVLPCPTYWEKYELVGTGCHPHLQMQVPVIDPVYDSKPEFWIVQELVKRVEPSLMPYFELTELEAAKILLETGGKECAGITVEQLLRGPVRMNVPDPECGLDEQIQHKEVFPPRAYPFKVEQQREFLKTGRMEFYKEEQRYQEAGETVPKFIPAFSHLTEEEQKFPLCIVTPHSKWRVHSSFANNPVLLNLNRRPVVEINPKDAATRGIRDGDLVEVFNHNGAYQLWACVTEAIKPGVVCVDHGQWDRYLKSGKYHSVTTHQKIKPTHETYFMPAVYAPGQHWKDTRVDVRRVD